MPHAIITGASTGIGAALALELARRGWAVGLVARRASLLDELADQIRAAGGTAATAAADVTDRVALEGAIAGLVEALGPCDLMVANAGVGIPVASHKAPVDAWITMFRLNVDGVLYAIAAVIPSMVARRSGHIAVVSSVAGFRGLPGFGAYSATKAAVSTLFESLRLDLRPFGITATAIHPGFVETPLTAKNKFKMPFLLKVDVAAKIIADGLERRRTVITFPWQMKILMGLLRFVPDFLYDRVAAMGARTPGARPE